MTRNHGVLFLIIFSLVLFLGCGRDEGEMFVYKGKRLSAAGDAARVVGLLKAGKPVAFRFCLADWGTALSGLLAAGRDGGLDLRPLVNDELMVCAACRRPLSARERFELLYAVRSVSKKQCPACGGEHFYIFLRSGK